MSIAVELIDNASLRGRFLELRAREGLTFATVAARAGWYGPDGKPDRSRVRWALGLVDGPFPSQPWRRAQTHVRYDTAVALAEALGLDPYEVPGL